MHRTIIILTLKNKASNTTHEDTSRRLSMQISWSITIGLERCLPPNSSAHIMHQATFINFDSKIDESYLQFFGLERSFDEENI